VTGVTFRIPRERPTLTRMEAAGRDEVARGGERAGTHSGRLLLRMPEELHAELARASESKGVSLNAFITATLASAVGWRDGAGAAGGGRARSRKRAASPSVEAAPRRRLVERLLVVNLIVVGAVGLAAIVLLVQAIR
jgi:HicB family